MENIRKTGYKCMPGPIKCLRIDLRAYPWLFILFVSSILIFFIIFPSLAFSEAVYLSGYKESGGEAFVYQGVAVIYRSGADSSTGWSTSVDLSPGTYTFNICLVDQAGNETWYSESRTIAAPEEVKQEKKEETVNKPSQQNNTSYTKNQPAQNNSPEYTKTEETTTQNKITTSKTSTSNKVKVVKKHEVNKKANKLLTLPFWALWGFLAFSVCGTSLYFGYRYKGSKNVKDKA